MANFVLLKPAQDANACSDSEAPGSAFGVTDRSEIASCVSTLGGASPVRVSKLFFLLSGEKKTAVIACRSCTRSVRPVRATTNKIGGKKVLCAVDMTTGGPMCTTRFVHLVDVAGASLSVFLPRQSPPLPRKEPPLLESDKMNNRTPCRCTEPIVCAQVFAEMLLRPPVERLGIRPLPG
jgi:hypothetical protein